MKTAAARPFLWLAVTLAVVAMATTARPTVHAQQTDESRPPRGDLSIISETHYAGSGRQAWRITVQNNLIWDFPVGDSRAEYSPGTTAATVKVRVVVNDGVNTPVPEVHTIRDLPAGRKAVLSVTFPTIAAGNCPSSPVVSRIHAEIIETDPLEPPALRFNNATEHAGVSCPGRKFTTGDAGVSINISDRSPQPEGTTTFTVKAENDPGPSGHSPLDHNNVQFDVQVKIDLSPGLSFNGTPLAPSGTTYDSNTRTWDVGMLTAPGRNRAGSTKSLPVAVSLSADDLADIPLEKRCLTAKVVRAQPWFAWDGTKRLNDTYTACLGKKPLVRLNQGRVNLFHYLDCVGVTTAPCTSADTLELVVRTPIGSTAPFIDNAPPDEFIVHISDPEGRHNGKWRTGKTRHHTHAGGNTPGVGVIFSYLPRTYNQYHEAISDVEPKQRPGELTILGGSRGTFKLLDADTLTSTNPFNLSASLTNNPYPAYVVFSTLGTYKVQITVGATKSSTPYTATGTYTFHVGPMADLEVRDAGASPAVAAGRQGYTMMALNNGPDIPPPAQVTLSGVPEGAEPVISHGSYAQGTCQSSLCAGVWAIGELGRGDQRAAGHANEDPTLTLITDATMPAAITATIGAQPYTVCIDSMGDDVVLPSPSETACTTEDSANTWHSTEYYDLIARNNTATITAHAGSGDGRPDGPGGVAVTETPVANIVQWNVVETVNGHEVTHYEVQRSASPWMTLDSDVKETAYLDITPGSDHPDYRVRAVNIFGVAGSWSQSAGRRPGLPQNFTATGVSDAQARLSWSAPAAVDGVTVAGYDLGFSTDGGNEWTSLAAGQSATTTAYTHTDSTLASGTTRQYRVRAVGTSGSAQRQVKSGWVFAAATRDYLTPGAPRNFVARPVSEARVELSWSAPEAVTGVTYTGFHLDFSTDGNTWTGLPTGQTRPVLSATTLTHTHTDDTLSPGAIRQYRVRSVGTGAGNAVFQSPWVFSSATTEEVGAPLNLAAAADGRNRIDLTWDLPAFGADLITGYRIDYTPATPEDWRTLESGHGTAPRQYEHAGLLPAERYCYRVAAVYPGGTGPFSARACATTAGAPTDLPGPPENLRIDRLGRNYVTLEWDAPGVGGAAEYYEYRYNNGASAAVSPPTATRMRVGGLQPGSHYQFQVRAGNAHGPGEWSDPVQTTLRQDGAAARATPAELSVAPGGSGSFNIRLSRSPQWPLMARFYAEGPNCLTTSLAGQQGKILLPGSPQPGRAFWADGWWGPPDDRWAAPWNAGVDIQVDAAGCQGGETAVVEYDLYSLPFGQLEGLPLWEELGLDEAEWREKWGVDPLDGTSGPSVTVRVTNPNARGPDGERGAAVNVSAELPPPAAVWRREERGLYGSEPVWDWWD